MNAHKYLAIFLAALLLTASACESSDASISDSTEYSGSDTSAASEDTAPIERCNYNGEEFHIYAPNWGGYPDYFFADEQNGEAMNDAIYTRTLLVEERLGIDITYLIEGTIDDTLTKVTSAVMSGDDPYPKLDETQKSYVNNDWGGLMAVPVNVGNPEMVGKACELLAFYSEDTTIPAYYDLMLGEKLARDNNSKEMLELIFENVFYDPGLYFFGFGKTQNLIHTIKNIVVLQQSDAIASHYSSVETAAKAEISTFCDNVLALDEYN